MRKLATLVFVFFLLAAASGLHAQSLKNTAWKFYVEPLHDTLVFHVGADSSFTTTSSGEVVIRSLCRVEKDTIKITDFEGQYYCPDGMGVYKYAVDGDILSFFLVNDPCSNRAEVLNGVKCKKAASK
jgi:hypothetical protein